MDEPERRPPHSIRTCEGPIRTCVGCRRRAAKSELLRVVADEGTLAPDRHHHPGRGAYLHRDPGCLDLAERRRALSQALRLPGGLDHSAIRAAIEASTTAPPLPKNCQGAIPEAG